MHTKLHAAFVAALGDSPTHVVRCQEGSNPGSDGKRRTYVFINPISAIRDRNSEPLMFRAACHELAQNDEQVIAAALEANKAVSIAFAKFPTALNFLHEVFAAIERETA